jgi:hypothetical protein
MKIAVLFYANTDDAKHDRLSRKYIKASRNTYPRYLHCVTLVDLSGLGYSSVMLTLEPTLSGGNITDDVMETVKLISLADRVAYAEVPYNLGKLSRAIAQTMETLNSRKMIQALGGKAPAPTCTEPANILLGTTAVLPDELYYQMLKMV